MSEGTVRGPNRNNCPYTPESIRAHRTVCSALSSRPSTLEAKTPRRLDTQFGPYDQTSQSARRVGSVTHTTAGIPDGFPAGQCVPDSSDVSIGVVLKPQRNRLSHKRQELDRLLAATATPKSFGGEISSNHRFWREACRDVETQRCELISPAATMAAVDSPDVTTSDLPSPPFISVPGLPNFRDAGGYELIADPPSTSSAEGKRRTKIIRRDAGAAQLSQGLGIRLVYDLRSAVEIARGLGSGHGFPLREWDGSERKFVPVFLDQDYSPEALALRYKNYAAESDEGFIEAYQDILKAATDPTNEFQPFKTILGHLAAVPAGSQSVPSSCLVHCTAGKDRTGVVIALALSLCGVPDEAVVHEYSLTEIGLRSRLEELVKHVSSNPKIGIDVEGARRMVGASKASRSTVIGGRKEIENLPIGFAGGRALAPLISPWKEAMLGTLARIRAQYGSIEQCVIDLGILTREGIAQLRKNLIVEADEDEVIRWQEHANFSL
ncbi:hypothetical protein CHU98_g4498 [Xylaria longipes]|nr:hypothetical protein CHU98_g4498 [Xylaria longipes]